MSSAAVTRDAAYVTDASGLLFMAYAWKKANVEPAKKSGATPEI